MTRYVLGFIVCLELKEVLLIEKLKPEFQRGYFNGIGGKVEYGEGIIQAMQREAKEECGLESNKDWKSICRMFSHKLWDIYCFTINVDKNEYQTLHSREKEQVISLSLNAIHPDNRKLLGNISWLVGMSVDRLVNNSYVSPEIKYVGLSLPFKF